MATPICGAGLHAGSPPPPARRGAAPPACDGRLTGRSCGSSSPASSKRCSTSSLGSRPARAVKQIALLRQLLLQRRQVGLRLRQRRLLRRDIAPRRSGPARSAGAGCPAAAVSSSMIASRRGDLAAQATPPAPPPATTLEVKRQIGRLELEALASRACAASDSTARRLAPNTSGTKETLNCGVIQAVSRDRARAERRRQRRRRGLVAGSA